MGIGTPPDLIEDPHTGIILPVITVVVLNERNQILLFKRNKPPYQGYWELVGGKVEFLEKVSDAAARELSEEAGINSVKPLFVTFYEHFEEKYHRILFCHLAKIKSTPKIVLTEHSEYGWFDYDNLPNPLIPYIKNAIDDGLKSINEKKN